MTPEQFLIKVESLLDGARPVEPGLYSLLLEDDRPVIIHGDSPFATPNLLAILISRDINEGPTTLRWTQIKDRYAIFTKRISKCQKPPQP